MATHPGEAHRRFPLAANFHWRLQPRRWQLPDALRGLAILLMVVFHGWYNLSVFRVVEMDFDALFWQSFRAVIVTLFCVTAGASMVWSFSRYNGAGRWLRRQCQLIVAAAAITGFSLLAYPDAWVYFGILHFFVVAYLLSLPLVNHPRTAILLGALLIMAERAALPLTGPWVFETLQPLIDLPTATMDRMYLLPWLGVFWIGMGSASWPGWQARLPAFPGQPALRWLGQHPLTLYLAHQPVLFGLTALLFSQ